MSKEFPRNKMKRLRSTSNETNNSFVKNMTTRISDLSATISRWFSSPNVSNSNGSAPTGDATDSSTEDEAPEIPTAIQPPAKRMRYTPSGNGNPYNAADGNQTYPVSGQETLETNHYTAVQSSPDQPTFQRGFVTPLPSTSEESASEFNMIILKSQKVQTSGGPSVSKKRKSLFDCRSRAEHTKRARVKPWDNTVRDPNKPSFKPSLLSSPFYPGPTNYGGAASSYINYPNITQTKNTVVNETSTENNAISYSSRRVLDLLEDFSSPLKEAQRIPQYERTTWPRYSDGCQYPNKVISYKTQELHVPSIASILQIKKRSRLMDVTSAARQLIASHSSTLGYNPPQYAPESREETARGSSNLTTKVKVRMSRQNRGDDNDLETMPTPVELPSAVLHIDKDQLPKFSFGTPSGSSLSSSSPPKLFSKYETKGQAYETNAMAMVAETPISKPKDNDIKQQTKDWQCPSCWVPNKSDADKCVCCECKKPSREREKPKCPVCKRGDSQPHCSCTIKAKPPSTKTVDLTKWKCEDCWVNNDVSVDICVCCGGKKRNSAPATPVPPNMPPMTSVENSNEWKCDDCWIKNKNNVDSCAACGAAKPKAKFTTINPSLLCPGVISPKPSDYKFKNIIKSQADRWECPSCLVGNDINVTKCVCCDTEQPGAAKQPEKKSFNFGVNTSFKFGIDPKLQEASASQLSQASEKHKVEECETNNNVTNTSFSFGVPPKKPEDQTDSPKKVEEKTVCAPKMNFSFGIPKSTTEPQPITSMFATVTKLPESVPKIIVTETEKPQEVPKVDFSVVKAQDTFKPSANFFTSPPATTTAPVKTDSVSSEITIEKKETTGNVLLLPVVTTSTEAMPQPAFTFTTTGGKLGSMFPVPTATTAVTSIPFAPSSSVHIFQKSEPTTTSPVTMFNSDPVGTSVALFTKADANAAPVPLSLTAVAPLFSFGTNAQPAAQAEPEKPKFNFSFGSNKSTDTTAVFKPTFGATDNNGNNFAVGIGSGSTVGVPATSTGSLGGGNGLPAIPLGASEPNTMSNPSAPPATSSIFGLARPKETLWSANNNSNNLFVTSAMTNTNNMFVSNATNTPQKPAQKAFSFGKTTPFNASGAAPFGTNSLTIQPFGSNSQPPPAFGSNAQPAANVFGLTNQNTSSPTLFQSATPSQGAANVFGTPASNPAPPLTLGMFGSPGTPAVSFGAPNASQAQFEAPSPAPAFNFGATQPPIFGFGQQQQPVQQAPPLSGVYSFGTMHNNGSSQVQFNMGSAPNMAVRRVRKAVRRNPQR